MPVHRLEADLGAQGGVADDVREAGPLANPAIFGERTAGLAHEPDRGRVDGFAAEGAEQSIRATGVGTHRVVRHAANASAAAATVASSTSRPCASDRNHASNGDGGNSTPESSMAPKNRA